jgi:hypothetical protein
MRKPSLLIAAAVLMVAASVLSGLATTKDQGGRKLKARLTGAAEVPGPGDTDGRGTAAITLNQGQNQVCFELKVSNIATATAAHIHEGAVGQAGGVVVMLTAPANGSSKDCVSADSELIKKIRQNPRGYYVNVHNADFPNGAVRGQLTK